MRKHAHNDEQSLHDHVAKHHVEQQLLVGPTSSFRGLGPFIVTDRCEQPVKIATGAFQFACKRRAIGYPSWHGSLRSARQLSGTALIKLGGRAFSPGLT